MSHGSECQLLHPSQAIRILWRSALLAAWLLCWTSSVVAQEESQETVQTTSSDATTPTAIEDFAGPAVLSRGSQPAAANGATDTIQPFVSVNRVYGTGLGGSLLALPSGLQSGLELGFGLRGMHSWRRMTLQLEYSGSYRDYSGQTVANGLNQFFTATLVSQLRRHLTLSIRQTGGILKQDLGSMLLQPAFLESSSTLAANEPFSNGLKLIDSIATVTYQKTRRLSFSGSIEGSLLRQDSLALIGTNSASITGDATYRLSNRASIGADYGFNHFSYTTFGSADIQHVAMDYSWRATKSIDIALQAGLNHGTTLALALAPLDPSIAAILGTGTGIQIDQRSINSPLLNARVTKKWRRASTNLSYLRGISPGNGLVLTSQQQAITAGVQYSFTNRWSLSMQAGRTSMAQLASVQSYNATNFGTSFSRLLRPGLQAVGRFSVLPLGTTALQGLNRTYYRAEFGFIFTPSQVPVSLR